MDDFYRIKRLPPYVFTIVNDLKTKARARGEDIIDLGMGNPDQATPEAHRRQAGRGRAQSEEPPLLGLEGDHAAPARRDLVVPRSLQRGARSRDGDHRDDRRQGGHGASRARGPSARRRRARAESDVPDPLVLGGHRGWRPALGAAGARRRLLRPPHGDGSAVVAQGQDAHPLVPAQSDHPLRGARLLREGGRLRPRARAHGGPRLRLRGLRLRRLPAAFVPRGAGGQGGRRRDLLAVEVLQHARMAHGLRLRQSRG